MQGVYPYWRLSLFYLFYYVALGTWIPFWPLYLEHLGYAFWVIGVTNAIHSSMRIFSPNIWGYIADKYNNCLAIIRLGACLGFFAILGILFTTKLLWLILILFVFSFFWSAVLPQFEVFTLRHLGTQHAHSYGRIRLWGSVGFVVAVVFGGWLLDVFPMTLFPWVISMALLGLWLSSLVVPHLEHSADQDNSTCSINPPPVHASSVKVFLGLLRKPHIAIHLGCVVLLQISFGPYYSFFSLLLMDLGYPVWSVGAFWTIAIGAEILVFIYARKLFDYIGIRQLMIASLILASVRWGLLGQFSESLFVLIFVQILHAFSFGSFHACMIETVRRQFPSGQHGKAQALFNSFGYGVGAVLGAIISGLLWATFKQTLFLGAAILPFIAAVLAISFLKTEHFQDVSDVR